jgi:hypothetical protein
MIVSSFAKISVNLVERELTWVWKKNNKLAELKK